MKIIYFLGIILQSFYTLTNATCYFPPEFQGDYKMQSTNSGGGVQYSTLNITVNSIPIWGNCHKRIGNNFILMINYGGDKCIRCLYLKLRSKSILQVLASSQETISKCYTNEESAIANCPSEQSLKNRSTAEIILFKTKDLEGNSVPREYCPLDGRYTLKYELNERSEAKRECRNYNSYLDFCPSGSTFNIYFQDCSFDNFNLKLDCLGQWEGPDNQMYLALVETRPDSEIYQYRCAMYKQTSTDIIHLAIGKDSTCINGLYSATKGYEMFELKSQNEFLWPPEITLSQCSFPEWLTGNWEHVRVEEDTFIYKDRSSLKTYTIKCVGMLDSEDKYLVFSKTQCDEKEYNCMKFQKRTSNVMEFQLGINSSSDKDVFTLCSDANFRKDAWITQGRINVQRETSCPISGEYTGLIPDTTELCAKLWSDCRAPDIMYYQVSDCVTYEVYEEREYRCLGHWKESDLLYTYTQRNNVGSDAYECFVGSIVPEKEDIYIKEAGEHCQRNIDPIQYGMKLVKQGLYSCIGHVPTNYDVTTKKFLTSLLTTATTKPWNISAPIPTISDSDNNINSLATKLSITTIFVTIVIFYL